MRIMLTTAALALLAGLTLAGQPVFAGGHYPHYGSYPHARHRGVASPEALARWYADRAHHQTVRAARLGCGYSGPRWRINWNGHYRWAFDQRPGKLRREVERRARGLTQCRRQISHHRRHWRHDWP